MLHERQVSCPYCGEQFTTTVDGSDDSSAGSVQQYIEDCYVCCRPIVFEITTNHDGDLTGLVLRREDE